MILYALLFSFSSGKISPKVDQTLDSDQVGLDIVCAVAEKLYAEEKRDYSQVLKVIAKIETNYGIACSKNIFGSGINFTTPYEAGKEVVREYRIGVPTLSYVKLNLLIFAFDSRLLGFF